MTITIKVQPVSGSLKQNAKTAQAKMNKAISAAANMAASMMEDKMRDSIASSGNFGERWTGGLQVIVADRANGVEIRTHHDIPFAGVFEEGATIHGAPLLWLPLSGTDAEGKQAKDYPGGLFSARRSGSGRPLLFSIADKMPKYFGIESVTIPPKWNLVQIQASVMGNFREYYEAAFKAAGA